MMSNKNLSFLLGALVVSTGAANVYPSTSNMENFLIVGMTCQSTGGDAVNLQNGEYGADQDVLSTDQCDRGTSLTDSSFPTMDSVYDQRWQCSGGCNPAPTCCVNYSYGGDDCLGPTAGVDWSGNIAVTSNSGQISVSNTDIYGDLKLYGKDGKDKPYDGIAILAASSNPVQSISNAEYFPMNHNPGKGNSIGKLPEDGKGKKGVGFQRSSDLTDLKLEIDGWRDSVIEGYDAEGTITQNIEECSDKNSNGPFIIELLKQGQTPSMEANLSFEDLDGDGVIIIDVNRGGDDWNINNSDVIIVGDISVTAIFRVISKSAMLIDNSSIQRSMEDELLNKIPAVLFAVGLGFDNKSGVAVMGGSNAVLTNVVFWELVGGSSDKGNNNIDCQNCQGCSQFIADMVLHTSTSRFMRCSFFIPVRNSSYVFLTLLPSRLADTQPFFLSFFLSFE